MEQQSYFVSATKCYVDAANFLFAICLTARLVALIVAVTKPFFRVYLTLARSLLVPSSGVGRLFTSVKPVMGAAAVEPAEAASRVEPSWSGTPWRLSRHSACHGERLRCAGRRSPLAASPSARFGCALLAHHRGNPLRNIRSHVRLPLYHVYSSCRGTI